MNKIEIIYHNNQKLIFNHPARFKVIAKGRRFGLTRGLANYVLQRILERRNFSVLWVDTIYANIERYYEKYFLPVLKDLDKNYWQWKSIKNVLRVVDSDCVFRSVDKPENMEGFGYNLIVINEAGIVLKNRKLWEETIQPMIIDYKAEVIIGGTPKGKMHKGQKHLFYELFEKEKFNSNYKSFQFSTYDNPLLDPEEIDLLANEMNISLRSQEIFGEFIDSSYEGIIKRNWWRYFRKENLIDKKNYGIFQSWDTAFKTNQENDYSVCTTWQITEDGFYLIDLFQERLEFPHLKKKVIELAEKFHANEILIEDHASGQSLIQELKYQTRLPIKAIKKDKDKISYVNAITPLIENGKVYLDEEINLQNLISECEEFPNSEHDDIVDSISQFLNYARNKNNERFELITKRIEMKRYYT